MRERLEDRASAGVGQGMENLVLVDDCAHAAIYKYVLIDCQTRRQRSLAKSKGARYLYESRGGASIGKKRSHQGHTRNDRAEGPAARADARVGHHRNH